MRRSPVDTLFYGLMKGRSSDPHPPQEIFGTGTMFNVPPSRDVWLNDTLDFAPLNGVRSIGELIDTVGNAPFCYVYE